MGVIRRIKKTLDFFSDANQQLDYIRTALGRIEARQTKGNENIDEFKVFSQWGEDGIIQWLINNIKTSRDIFIEFGVEDYSEANTRFLLVNNNWSGLVIDGSEENIRRIKSSPLYWRYNLKAECAFITAENINDLFRKNGIEGNIGILSIDIDGNDYWVWKAIDCVRPDIVICEYNHRYGMEKAVTTPYDPDFIRMKAHYSGIYYGASIAALAQLAEKKGYSLVAGNGAGNNVFFVRNDLLNENVRKKSIEDVFVHGKFRESRSPDGSLSYLDLAQEQEILKALPLVDVSGE